MAHMTNTTIKQKMKVFIKPDLLIIDEIGYRKMDETTAHYFFQIVSERYERGTIVLTPTRHSVVEATFLERPYWRLLSWIAYCNTPAR
jgi:DNA replication protein DnaC